MTAPPPAAWDDLQRRAETCTACPLASTRTQVVFGAGARDARLVFIGEGPGEQEDRQGLPFVGRSGALLSRLIGEIGLTRDAVYIANVVKCRPPGNRNPKPMEIATCRPFLDAQLDLLRPAVFVPLGNFATQWLLETKTGITRLRGQRFPYRSGVIIPTLHPAAVLRGGGSALALARVDFAEIKDALGEAVVSA